MRKYYIKFGIITVLLISLIVFSIVYFFKVPKCPKDTNFKCFTEGFTNIKIKNPESALKVIEENAKTMGVLVECGFLSNPNDRALLVKEEYQKALANVLYKSIKEYFDFLM